MPLPPSPSLSSARAGRLLEAALVSSDARSRTPLLAAAAHGRGAAVAALAAAGAPLEQADAGGNTPLLCACASGSIDGVQCLLGRGAAASHRNVAGHDALACAAIGGHVALLPLLLPLCSERVPEAMVHAALAEQPKVALALAELCPLPLPPPADGAKTHSACAQLVQALWQRSGEETLAATSPPPSGRAASRSGDHFAPASPVAACQLPSHATTAAMAAGAVLVSSDVIEHLMDPFALLSLVQRLLAAGAVSAVFSTPERDIIYNEDGAVPGEMWHPGPPSNDCHVREWNLHEFKAMLRCFPGLELVLSGVTQSSDLGPEEGTSVAVVRLDIGGVGGSDDGGGDGSDRERDRGRDRGRAVVDHCGGIEMKPLAQYGSVACDLV